MSSCLRVNTVYRMVNSEVGEAFSVYGAVRDKILYHAKYCLI